MPGRCVAGVDGAPGGWVAVVGEASRPSDSWMVFAGTLTQLFEAHPRVSRWAIDMPLGLEETHRRACDSLAREALGAKRSSVFFAPPRSVVASFPMSYEAACDAALSATGKKLSLQTFNLLAKVQEARNLLIDQPRLRGRVLETHPELCFMSLNDGGVLLSNKKSKDGRSERVALLGKRFGQDALRRFVAQTQQTPGVNIDDTIDAAACWTAASRALQGKLRVLPDDPPSDRDGIQISISF